MEQRVVDVELTAAVTVAPGVGPADTVAVLFRYGRRPVGFGLYPAAKLRGAPAADIAESGCGDVRARVVEAALRAETGPVPGTGRAVSVSVAICTRDRPDWLRRCLQSLSLLDRRDLPQPVDLEIIVIDNAPTDDRTRRVVAETPQCSYHVEPRPGLNFARNAALRLAGGQLVAFVDDDAVVDQGWLAGLLSAWLADPDAGFFTGQVLPLELATGAQLLYERRGGFRRGFTQVLYRQARKGDAHYPCDAGIFGTGANMAVDRDAALALGGFDEALDTGAPLPGGGDLDMFYRMIRAGYGAVYEPAYLVFHQHRRDMEALRRQYRDSWGRSYGAFAVKSWRADPALRSRWLRHMAWWFAKQASQFGRSALGQNPRPLGLILIEAWGGVAGLLGAYDRSVRSVEQIRSRHP